MIENVFPEVVTIPEVNVKTAPTFTVPDNVFSPPPDIIKLLKVAAGIVCADADVNSTVPVHVLLAVIGLALVTAVHPVFKVPVPAGVSAPLST